MEKKPNKWTEKYGALAAEKSTSLDNTVAKMSDEQIEGELKRIASRKHSLIFMITITLFALIFIQFFAMIDWIIAMIEGGDSSVSFQGIMIIICSVVAIVFGVLLGIHFVKSITTDKAMLAAIERRKNK